LRRWCRVLRSSLRCFFFDMRLRRFLITEPMGYLTKSDVTPGIDAHKTPILPRGSCECEITMREIGSGRRVVSPDFVLRLRLDLPSRPHHAALRAEPH